VVWLHLRQLLTARKGKPPREVMPLLQATMPRRLQVVAGREAPAERAAAVVFLTPLLGLLLHRH
jgi:hypothetical protein